MTIIIVMLALFETSLRSVLNLSVHIESKSVKISKKGNVMQLSEFYF